MVQRHRDPRGAYLRSRQRLPTFLRLGLFAFMLLGLVVGGRNCEVRDTDVVYWKWKFNSKQLHPTHCLLRERGDHIPTAAFTVTNVYRLREERGSQEYLSLTKVP